MAALQYVNPASPAASVLVAYDWMAATHDAVTTKCEKTPPPASIEAFAFEFMAEQNAVLLLCDLCCLYFICNIHKALI